jgi:pimeloyl-ACP methyl ester carboxylesterase
MRHDDLERRVEVNGLSFRVLEQGEGPAVLLLHGFPDSADLWRNQMRPLAEAGFRAVAPDLRGFGESDKPEGVDQYGIEPLVGDVLGIMEACGIEQAHVIGHDWGAFLAWVMAALAADRVERLATLSVGHPNSWGRESQKIAQRRASWYMLMFNADGLAESALADDDWRLFRDFTGDAVDVERYVTDLGRPGALTAALNWYRANIPLEVLVPAQWTQLPAVASDTLGVWSSGDVYCLEPQVAGSGDFVTGRWRYERIDDVDHWIPLSAPDQVNDLLVDFLTG